LWPGLKDRLTGHESNPHLPQTFPEGPPDVITSGGPQSLPSLKTGCFLRGVAAPTGGKKNTLYTEKTCFVFVLGITVMNAIKELFVFSA
jgi:hypothetical protein